MAPSKQPALPARKKAASATSTQKKQQQPAQPSANALLANGAQFITLADGTQASRPRCRARAHWARGGWILVGLSWVARAMRLRL